MKTVLLWLLILNLGIALGAGLYESRIVFPQWWSPADAALRWNAAAAREANTGLRFWVFVTTVPLTLLTAANLIAASRSKGAVRRWWMSAALLTAADRVFTFAYFIPTMIRLTQDPTLPEAQATAMAMQWGNLNFVRHSILLLALLAALKTLSLQGRSATAPEERSIRCDSATQSSL